jgi:hypothetical protein
MLTALWISSVRRKLLSETHNSPPIIYIQLMKRRGYLRTETGRLNIAKLEIWINVTMYQLCVSEEDTWNVTEIWTEGINGKMPLIKQLQNTVNYQFLYDFIKDWWSEVGKPVGAKFFHFRIHWPQIAPSSKSKEGGTWRQPHNTFQILGYEWVEL